MRGNLPRCCFHKMHNDIMHLQLRLLQIQQLHDIITEAKSGVHIAAVMYSSILLLTFLFLLYRAIVRYDDEIKYDLIFAQIVFK